MTTSAATSQPSAAPSSTPVKSWIPIFSLLLLVGAGGCLRLDNIARQNLWLDEYWTLYLTTGRGDSIFHSPSNQILEHPPIVGFTDAPRWWHIWNGIDTTSHPPLYHILLRFWVDLMGDGDQSIRLMSAFFSLGCIVLLYIAVRTIGGDQSEALIAASLMALAPVQILYSQQARPYTMLQFIALAAAIVLISVKKRGGSWFKFSLLAAAIVALMLTHYFSAGIIAAFAVYSLIAFRGRNRWGALLSIAVGFAVAASAWGSHLRELDVAGFGTVFHRHLFHMLLSVPQRLTWESNVQPRFAADDASWPSVLALAALVYLFPLLWLRRRRYLLFWWLWIVGTIGVVFAIDIHRNSGLLSIIRYVIPAAPAVYAILAVPLPTRIGKWSPWIILIGVLFFAIDYWQTGPPVTPNFSFVSERIKREVAPDDVLIITGRQFMPGIDEPPLTYFLIAHYVGPLNGPIVFATEALGDQVGIQLRHYRRIWVVGHSPAEDTRNILPGWQTHDIQEAPNHEALWSVTPGKPGNL